MPPLRGSCALAGFVIQSSRAPAASSVALRVTQTALPAVDRRVVPEGETYALTIGDANARLISAAQAPAPETAERVAAAMAAK
jgi:hypothetical protein